MPPKLPTPEEALPKHLDLFYSSTWHAPQSAHYQETYNPGTGQVITEVAQAGAEDVDAAVESAHTAFQSFKHTPPSERAAMLRKAAQICREHSTELAFLDALDTGNPIAEMLNDANVAAASMDYFAGLIPMLKGETIPQSDSTFHYTIREPLGLVARIIAFNHPVMFAGAKLAPPIAAGNCVLIKPPDQAPLSCLRLAELLTDVFPPGVLSILPGGAECGQRLSSHPKIAKISLIGSIPTAKAIARTASETLKSTLFELGGKNPLIAYPDADIPKLVEGIARGMNFTWAGQSCGSTSRVFLHESIHDKVMPQVVEYIQKNFVPGPPTEMKTTMGPVISRTAQARIQKYIRSGVEEGATLLLGNPDAPSSEGGYFLPPTEMKTTMGPVISRTAQARIQKYIRSGVEEGATLLLGNPDAPSSEGGYFLPPTIFTSVQPHMTIAREEIFGPVMSVSSWSSEEELYRIVNSTPYGLTASIYTKDISTAQRAVKRVEAGYVWVNQVGRHFLGVPFGGYKESGGGREECLEELLGFTQVKSVSFAL